MRKAGRRGFAGEAWEYPFEDWIGWHARKLTACGFQRIAEAMIRLCPSIFLIIGNSVIPSVSKYREEDGIPV